MTNDDAIQEIQYYMNSDCYLDAPSNEACQLAISALERDRWISVEERKPFSQFGEGVNVLTCDELGVMRVAYWDGGNWCWPSGECISTAREFPITHWRTLPEPPEDEP